MNTKGLKIVCRDLYAENADPERQPLTTRFDEVDAALIFDDVVVPWERIFVYKDPKLLAGIMYIHTWGQYSTMLRLITKLEAFLGVAQLLTQMREAQHQRILANTFIESDARHRNPALLHSSRRIQGLPGRRRHLGAAVERGLSRAQHRSVRSRRTNDGRLIDEHSNVERRRARISATRRSDRLSSATFAAARRAQRSTCV